MGVNPSTIARTPPRRPRSDQPQRSRLILRGSTLRGFVAIGVGFHQRNAVCAAAADRRADNSRATSRARYGIRTRGIMGLPAVSTATDAIPLRRSNGDSVVDTVWILTSGAMVV